MSRIVVGLALFAISYATAVEGKRSSESPHCDPGLVKWNASGGKCVTSIDGYQLQSAPDARGRCQAAMPQAAMDGGPCHFDLISLSFAGSPMDQARCMLKHVKRGGALGSSDLTPALAALVDRPAPPLEMVSRYLAVHHISPAQTGGPLTAGLRARYFVIHDTSSPNCSNLTKPSASCPVIGVLPPAMNSTDWPHNQTFGNFISNPSRLKAHVITNRVGESISARDFKQHVSHVRFDYCNDATAKTGLFVGVENIQPRVAGPRFVPPTENDVIAPVPGFTDAQYERLALLYMIASSRRGRWLIPAYHSPIDAYYAGGHDDPQNFDMVDFTAKLQALIAALGHS